MPASTMLIFTNPRLTSIKLKTYPTYILYGRIREEDVSEYEQTKNDKLILYKFCENYRKPTYIKKTNPNFQYHKLS